MAEADYLFLGFDLHPIKEEFAGEIASNLFGRITNWRTAENIALDFANRQKINDEDVNNLFGELGIGIFAAMPFAIEYSSLLYIYTLSVQQQYRFSKTVNFYPALPLSDRQLSSAENNKLSLKTSPFHIIVSSPQRE